MWVIVRKHVGRGKCCAWEKQEFDDWYLAKPSAGTSRYYTCDPNKAMLFASKEIAIATAGALVADGLIMGHSTEWLAEAVVESYDSDDKDDWNGCIPDDD